MHCNKLLRVTAVLAVFIPWSLLAKAAPIEEGVVDEVRGSVKVTTAEGKVRAVGLGVFLFSGDIVDTGRDGFIRIIMNGGTVLELRPQTRIHICDSRTTKNGNSAVVVYLGRIWSWVAGGTSGETTFEAHTPSAVAGVRGTEFSLAVGIDGSTRVGVDEGTVSLEGETNQVMVSRNYESEVEWSGRARLPRLYQRGEEEWKKWGEARQEFLIKNAEKILPWMLAEVKRSRENLRDLRAAGLEKFQALKQKVEARRQAGKRPLTAGERREIAEFLAQVLFALQQLERADRRMMTKYYLLTRLHQETLEKPAAYPPEFRAAVAQIMEELKTLDINRIHEENRQIIDGYTEAIDRIATQLKLWPLLQRRVAADRREALIQARKHYQKNRRTPR